MRPVLQESGPDYQPALKGVRVLDLSAIAAGPYLSSLLGDFGADVIKVEQPEGEPFRRIDNDFGPGESSYFFAVNRSKRSVTLDLKQQSDRNQLDQLIQTADVLIVSMRPAVLRRLRLDYDQVASTNPQIVYTSITGYGDSGPRADEPGMDILAQALGGAMGTTGQADGPPVKVGPPIADFATSFLGAFAICAALRARDRDGIGQKISLNLLDSTIALLANYVTPYFKTRIPVKPVGGGHPQLVPYQVFEAQNGYIVVGCLNDRFWSPLCQALGTPELAKDPRFSTNALRVKHRDVLIPRIAQVLSQAPVDVWLDKFKHNDVPGARVNTLAQVFDDEQVKHNGMLTQLLHPDHGPYFVTSNPIQMSRTPARPSRYAPRLGEHTEEVMRDLRNGSDKMVEHTQTQKA
jgi:crotonobetainyl-CoA:carnitine CoA-transferase CaiB-like acyl-CoA transferase